MRRGNLLWISGKSVRLPRQCAFNQGMIAPGNHDYWKIRCALQHWLAMTCNLGKLFDRIYSSKACRSFCNARFSIRDT